jgi:cytochrome c peroxidase
MIEVRRFNILSVLIVLAIVGGYSENSFSVDFTDSEKAIVSSFGPWPPRPLLDSSNRLSQNQVAIRFGESLFFDHALGGETNLSCASCHDPGKAFTDGRISGQGKFKLNRNTPSLVNISRNRWFGWGGESDSLWSQSIRPILSPQEMSGSAHSVKQLIIGSDRYRQFYQQLFARFPQVDDAKTVLVNSSKALAAYQETLVTGRTAFDDFRDAMLIGDSIQNAKYSESAQLGLKLFVGKGQCFLCHQGPDFSNREFADIGIDFFVEGGVDSGRYQGIKSLWNSPYNRSSIFNDGDSTVNGLAVRYVKLQHRNWGEFKIPGLRAVSETAPYMHNGSVPDLRAVILHYSELDESRLHSNGEKILKPLDLSETEISAMVEFLQSLSTQY